MVDRPTNLRWRALARGWLEGGGWLGPRVVGHSKEEGEVGFVVYGGGGDNFLEMVEREFEGGGSGSCG